MNVMRRNNCTNVLCNITRLSQTNSDLNEVRMELERHSEHNSRLINSLNDNEASIFDNEMENYRSDYTRLQKANRILINEIKDLLNTCYGSRTV